MAFEDTILIKLHRDYSKDELVEFALRRIKELKINNGKNESYIQELVKENSDLKADIRNKRYTKGSITSLKKVENYKKTIDCYLNNIWRLKQEVNHLKQKLSNLCQ